MSRNIRTFGPTSFSHLSLRADQREVAEHQKNRTPCPHTTTWYNKQEKKTINGGKRSCVSSDYIGSEERAGWVPHSSSDKDASVPRNPPLAAWDLQSPVSSLAWGPEEEPVGVKTFVDAVGTGNPVT